MANLTSALRTLVSFSSNTYHAGIDRIAVSLRVVRSSMSQDGDVNISLISSVSSLSSGSGAERLNFILGGMAISPFSFAVVVGIVVVVSVVVVVVGSVVVVVVVVGSVVVVVVVVVGAVVAVGVVVAVAVVGVVVGVVVVVVVVAVVGVAAVVVAVLPICVLSG